MSSSAGSDSSHLIFLQPFNDNLGLGSPELTKLWGRSRPNLEACKTENRQFIPKVHSFFEEAMEHADPANEIEDQYKCYKNAEFGWRSLRLLAHASPHFFSLQPANMHHLAVPKYLEHILKKLLKEVADKEPKEEAEENKTLGIFKFLFYVFNCYVIQMRKLKRMSSRTKKSC